MGSPCKKQDPKKVTQKADKHRSLKLKEEGPYKWAEPARTPIIANPSYEIIFNLHTGKHAPMLVAHDTNHEGIVTEEELKKYEANRGKFRHGFRVALEGNIGSGKQDYLTIQSSFHAYDAKCPHYVTTKCVIAGKTTLGHWLSEALRHKGIQT